MSLREVPSDITIEMTSAFIRGFDTEDPESVNDALIRINVASGYRSLLAAAPSGRRPRVDNIPGNGGMRNLRKFKIEGTWMLSEMRPHMLRWLNRPWSMHDFTNMFVEAARLSPYLIGHINVVFYPLFVLLAIFGWFGS